MRYSTVLMDADRTLLDFDEDEKQAFIAAMDRFSLKHDEALLERYRAINDLFWKRYELGEVEKSEIGPGRFGELLKVIGSDADNIALNLAYMELLSEGGALIEGADELCRTLRENGFRLYIITNGTDFIQEKRLRRSGLSAIAHGVFISDVLGVQKPKKEYFDAVLSRIGPVSKEEILVVGDSLSSDILGGINAGLDTCLITHRFVPESREIKPTYTVSGFEELKNLLLSK